jgi:hypothetical protein
MTGRSHKRAGLAYGERYRKRRAIDVEEEGEYGNEEYEGVPLSPAPSDASSVGSLRLSSAMISAPLLGEEQDAGVCG